MSHWTAWWTKWTEPTARSEPQTSRSKTLNKYQPIWNNMQFCIGSNKDLLSFVCFPFFKKRRKKRDCFEPHPVFQICITLYLALKQELPDLFQSQWRWNFKWTGYCQLCFRRGPKCVKDDSNLLSSTHNFTSGWNTQEKFNVKRKEVLVWSFVKYCIAQCLTTGSLFICCPVAL